MDNANKDLVRNVKQLCLDENKPMVISIGGKSNEFTDNLINGLKEDELKAYILHTVSIYPTPVGQSNVNYIRKLIDKYEDDDIKIGYSGHEIGYSASLVAADLGANMIERHLSLSRDLKIHHIQSALLPNEFKDMVGLIGNLRQENISSFENGFSEAELGFLKHKKYE